MCRLPHHGKGDTGCRVEVDAQLVGVLGIGSLAGPDVEPQTAHVHGPEDVGEVGGDEGARGRPVGGGDDCRLQPLRPALGNTLLEERRATGAVGKPLQEHRPPTHGGEQRGLHRLVEAHQVELGVAALVEEDLLGMTDGEVVTARLNSDAVAAWHGDDRTPSLRADAAVWAVVARRPTTRGRCCARRSRGR